MKLTNKVLSSVALVTLFSSFLSIQIASSGQNARNSVSGQDNYLGSSILPLTLANLDTNLQSRETKGLRDQNLRLYTELSELRDKYKILESKASTFNSDNNSDQLKKDLKALADENSKLKFSLTAAEAKIFQVTSQAKVNSDNEVAALKANTEALNSKIIELTNINDSLSAKVKTVSVQEEQISNLKSQIEKIHKEYQLRIQKINEEDDQLRLKLSDAQKWERLYQEAKDKLSALEVESQKYHIIIAELEDKVKNAPKVDNKALEQARNSLEELKTENFSLKEKISHFEDLEAVIKSLKEKIAVLEIQLTESSGSSKKGNDDCTNERDELKVKLEAFEDKFLKLNKQYEENKKSHESMEYLEEEKKRLILENTGLLIKVAELNRFVEQVRSKVAKRSNKITVREEKEDKFDNRDHEDGWVTVYSDSESKSSKRGFGENPREFRESGRSTIIVGSESD